MGQVGGGEQSQAMGLAHVSSYFGQQRVGGDTNRASQTFAYASADGLLDGVS